MGCRAAGPGFTFATAADVERRVRCASSAPACLRALSALKTRCDSPAQVMPGQRVQGSKFADRPRYPPGREPAVAAYLHLHVDMTCQASSNATPSRRGCRPRLPALAACTFLQPHAHRPRRHLVVWSSQIQQ